MTGNPLADWKTTEQVADALGITTGRVRQLARHFGLGIMVGRARLYSAADVEVMRNRATKSPGRPPKRGTPGRSDRNP